MAAFEVVGEETAIQDALGVKPRVAPIPTAQNPAQQANARAQKVLLFAIAQLSKRAISGLSAAFSLIALGSVFALYSSILESPNTFQLVGVGLYSLFVLSLEILRRSYKSE